MLYRGNALADKHASKASGDPCCPALSREGAFTLWCDRSRAMDHFGGPLWHVSGDLRASLKSVERTALLERWQEGTTAQGDVARSAGAALSHFLEAVRRTRERTLFTFLLKAATKQLATADKLFPALRRIGSVPPCPLCQRPEDHMHALSCRSEHGLQRAALASTTRGLRELCNWVASTGAVSPAHCAWLDTVCSTAAFFNVRSRGCPIFAQHDPYAGALGIVPHGFHAELAPDSVLTGPERAVKFLRTHLPEQVRSFQLAALRATMMAYNGWVARARTGTTRMP